jgi:hypothetical protein
MAAAIAFSDTRPIPFALAVLAALYVAPEGERAIAAPLFAGGLFLAAELAYWAVDERLDADAEPETFTPRLLAILAVAGASTVVGAVVLAASEIGSGRSPALTAAGALAAVACVALLVVLARDASGARR